MSVPAILLHRSSLCPPTQPYPIPVQTLVSFFSPSPEAKVSTPWESQVLEGLGREKTQLLGLYLSRLSHCGTD